ncbi:MAG: endonuclease III domain-containing protein [Candidatus Hinthialibacter antarcticus]|nr:endonuclease III domain-containing protein [Candidatus Hinthialibacter antarcticus]
MKPDLLRIYKTLRAHFGHRDWWPGDGPLEIAVGAILTQNTNWKNVEKAIANLKQAKALSYRVLRDIETEALAQLIRPSGYFNQKAKKLKALIDFIERNYNGSLKRLFAQETQALREGLLSVKGIGPETADSILLYAGGHVSFVIDLYTYRVLTRHGWISEDATYSDMKELFEGGLPREMDLYNDYHAQLVAVGNNFCRKTPKCEGCPLEALLPNGKRMA